ncbi:hypothetical protein ACFPN2_35015 [Steroidobacter flavus]|uniref:Uncharacterized protein n=1 Tax=Steroidobacter flavus TaxID=1842136 RepID=A0ABV8T326_9GAMM
MLRESSTIVLARNETWRGDSATEPVEAGWASEAVFFVRALRTPVGAMPEVFVEISPDGMHWVREGSNVAMPTRENEVAAVRVAHFGNWLRLRSVLPTASECVVLVTLHLK